MSEIISMIKRLPINKISEVYLIGSDSDYYRIFLMDKSKYAVKIDLKKGLKGNFLKAEKSSIYMGHLTISVTPKRATELLINCKYIYDGSEPNKETFDLVLNLLNICNFTGIKRDKTNHTFASWLLLQEGRDDLIGDIESDISRDPKLSGLESYEEIEESVKNAVSLSSWDINSLKDCKKEGVVNPLLCLELAKMEYDIYLKKSILNEFAIRDKSGFVYFLKYENEDSLVKIGRTKNITARVSQLQTSLPYDLEVIGYIETDDYFELENKFHEEFKTKRERREWFNLTKNEALDILHKNNGILGK